MDLEVFWFILIGVLWAGYFLLEGFDFGVGMLLPVVPRNETERGVMFRSIGPFWDGNEVWLVVAGGATFAAFPAWYAAMFSGFYLALLVILVCLIVRVLSFEWRSRTTNPRWRSVWLWANTLGSLGASLVWGVAFANLLQGVPLNSDGDYTGDFWDLFSPYTVFAGLAVVLLFAFHGATFLTLRTRGDVLARASGFARRLAIPAAAAGAIFLAWTVVVATDENRRDLFPPIVPAILGIAALAAAVLLTLRGRSGLAFLATGAGAMLVIATIFVSLYPRVMVSSSDFSNSLTVENASSAHYPLVVMTVVALIATPVVLLYQGWTYHVFRARLGAESPAAESPGEPPAQPVG